MVDINEIAEQLSESEIDSSNLIPISLYNRKQSKFFSLINNESANSIKLNRQEYSVKFKSLLYIESIKITIEGTKANEFVVRAFRDGKAVKELSLKCENGSGSSYIDLMTDRISIKPKAKIFRQSVKSIQLYGFNKFKYERLEKEIYEATLLRGKFDELYGKKLNELEEKQAQLKDNKAQADLEITKIIESIESEKAILQELESSVKSRTKELNSIIRDIEIKREQERTIDGKIEKLTDQKSLLETSKTSLNKEVAEKEARLKDLTDNVNLFTDEISSFAKESNKHIRIYMAIAIIPLSILVYVTTELVGQAEGFLAFYKEESVYNVWEIFLARLPFVAVSAFLIEVSFYIIWSIYKRIITIHQERLSLSKLSIIARDVSDYASDGLKRVSDEHKYQLRTSLKMDLIKSHLTNELGKEYKYTPTKEKMGRLWKTFSKKGDQSAPESE